MDDKEPGFTTYQFPFTRMAVIEPLLVGDWNTQNPTRSAHHPSTKLLELCRADCNAEIKIAMSQVHQGWISSQDLEAA